MVTSNSYRQGTESNPVSQRLDPANQFYWRFSPRRLDAETIRDSMLAISGLLDLTAYGPGSLDPSMRRRSIYFFIKRSQLIPFLLLFDFPERLVSIGRRATTNIAPQGLALMNSPIVREYAVGLADRALSQSSGHSPSRVVKALYWLVYSRSPTESEEEHALAYLRQHHQNKSDLSRSERFVDLAHTLLMSNEFLYLR